MEYVLVVLAIFVAAPLAHGFAQRLSGGASEELEKRLEAAEQRIAETERRLTEADDRLASSEDKLAFYERLLQKPGA